MRTEKLTGPDVASLLKRARRALGDEVQIVSVNRAGLGYELVAACPASPGDELTVLVGAPPTSEAKQEPPAKPVAPSPRSYSATARYAGPYLLEEDKPVRPAVEAAVAPRPVRTESVLPVTPRPDPNPPARPSASRSLSTPASWLMRPGIPVRHKLSGTPPLIALVGPTGSGKTTTIAKIANHEAVFGGWPVGLLCLDTYRVGAFEQLRAYAELSDLPIEVAHDPGDVEAALRRLGERDVVLVDTAGRGPRQAALVAQTLEPLRAIAPVEVHLTLPAGLRLDHARRILEHHRPLGVTHIVATKLDECLGDDVALTLAAETGLAMRWVTHGQEVPADLGSAARLRAERMGAAA